MPTLTTLTIGATDVELNEEGFFVHPEQWTEEMVPDLARREGIDPLTDAHWKVIRFMAAGWIITTVLKSESRRGSAVSSG